MFRGMDTRSKNPHMMNKLKFSVWAVLYLLPISLMAQQYHRGLLLDEAKYNKVAKTAALAQRSYTDLPRAHNLVQYAPKPGDQGPTGTCTAWAIAYGARTVLEAHSKGLTDKDQVTANTFSPSFIYNQIRLESGCEEGTYISDGLDLLSQYGASKFRDYGFECHRDPGAEEFEQAENYRIQGYKRLFDYESSNKILPVKKSIAGSHPVVFGMMCPDSFFDAGDVWNVNSLEYTNSHAGGHAVVVIGYDDDKYGGAFLIQNSWGTSWGNQGLTWIRYRDFNEFTFEAYELIPKAPLEVDLIGEITFLRSDQVPMTATYVDGSYKMDVPHKSGTQFRFYVKNDAPAYVYALGTDNTGKIFRIFPHREGISPYLGSSNSTLAFPDEEHFVQMDDTQGEDIFCVLYSKTELDLDRLIFSLENSSGDFREKLEYHFRDVLIPGNLISFNEKEIAFTARSGDRSIVPIIIKIDHL